MTKIKKNQEIHLDLDGTSDNIVYGDILDITRKKGTLHVKNLGGTGPVDMDKHGDVGTFQGREYYHVGRDAWYPWLEYEEKEFLPFPGR
jgi:hypothetical protein